MQTKTERMAACRPQQLPPRWEGGGLGEALNQARKLGHLLTAPGEEAASLETRIMSTYDQFICCALLQ
jgi:hypothetical protein